MLLIASPLQILAPASAQEATATPTNNNEAVSIPPPPEYIYNEQTGLWENGIYAWDPVTQTTKPLLKNTYSYNPETEHWDTEGWVYDPATGAYSERTVKTTPTPAPEIGSQAESQSSQLSPTVKDASPLQAQSSSRSGENASDSLPTAGSFYDGFYDADISINVSSSAVSGNAQVANNTLAGDATSGAAIAQASILNMVNSQWGGGQAPPVYTITMQGGHVGDILLDPTAQVAVNSPTNPSGSLAVTNTESVSLDNDVVVHAQSGNATIAGNTSAGSATTGDALALVTIVNLINSSVSAGESFIGILNILGDFEGDVLLPEHLQKELARTYAPHTEMTLDPAMQQALIDNNTNVTTSTAVNANATSGDANVTGNTIGGSSATGDAQTTVTVYNITGQQILSENAMLVFVNVLGEWVGLITNAPQGARSALLSCCDDSNVGSGSATDSITNTSDYTITNTVAVSAVSGDARVEGNTVGGDATSGSAYAAANIVNLANTSISLSGWYTVLFINIFGSWNGSFGIDTIYGGYSTQSNTGGESTGTPVPTIEPMLSLNSTGSATQQSQSAKLSLTPPGSSRAVRATSNSSESVPTQDDEQNVAGISTETQISTPEASEQRVASSARNTFPTVYVGLGIGVLAMVVVLRRFFRVVSTQV